MTLSDMIKTLRIRHARVEIRDEEGNEMLTCGTDSKAISPYLSCEVTEWFPGAAPFKSCDFTVYIKE